MSKLVKTSVPFGMVPNLMLNDKRISLKAKGLFAFMQSKPDGWNFSAKMIAAQSKESIDSIFSGLKELEKFGFLTRKKLPTSKGFSTTYHLIFDAPIADFPILENPILENPILENPSIGKCPNNSKKEVSKKEVSNKEKREGTALEFFETNYPSRFEVMMMQYKKQIQDFERFEQSFNATVMQERLEWDGDVLEGRFVKYALNWVSNQNRFERKVIELNPVQPARKFFKG